MVWKLDRPGRKTSYVLELLDGFKARGMNFHSLRDGITTSHGRIAGRQEVTATHPNVKQAHALKKQRSKLANAQSGDLEPSRDL
ncbi:recombinase family protein [Arthrobacter antibioticus]|uniref:recombinase family protein n=1 Tax=Arthrobacter sp. H35-MC1 TaxID=3046203 RepID=UPI0024BA421E|nr:recombinase family protein [Arthrobacter sp. H35-MC1]MDJ0316860.1 recombinase family protein [Arthrobacter sp. H35-MC1]